MTADPYDAGVLWPQGDRCRRSGRSGRAAGVVEMAASVSWGRRPCPWCVISEGSGGIDAATPGDRHSLYKGYNIRKIAPRQHHLNGQIRGVVCTTNPTLSTYKYSRPGYL